MSDYVLSCCSTADVTRAWLEDRDIKYLYFNYYLNGEACKDDFGVTNSPAELYAKMLAGADAKTSQVSAGDYAAHFEKFLAEGKDVLHVTLSSGISSTFNSACIARDQLAEKYPDRKVVVVDSLAASAGYGLLMDRLADLRDAGMGLDELAAWAEEHKLEVQHWFFSSDLTFFVRGGAHLQGRGARGRHAQDLPGHGRGARWLARRQGEDSHQGQGHRPRGGEDGRARRGRPRLLRQGLHLPVRVRG